MKLSFANERLLAVMAHPDDAELLCAGTLARAKGDGAAIGICVICKGDKGVASESSPGDLGNVRETEAKSAASVLGAELFWFGAADGELFDSYDNRRKLIEMYRRYAPTLVIAHAIEDYHPDHRAASQIAEAASWFCASRGHVTATKSMDSPPRLWFADTLNLAGFEPEMYIDVSSHVAIKKQMLNCHKTQLQRGKDGDFAPLMDLMVRQYETRGSQSNVAAAEAFRTHRAFKRVAAM